MADNKVGFLKATGTFANPYEEYFANHVGTARFDEKQWDKFYKSGDANSFVNFQNDVDAMDDKTYYDLYKRFRFDLEQGDYRMGVLANRLYTDNIEIKEWTYDTIDEYGQKVINKFTGTEMQYNELQYEQYAKQLEEQERLNFEQMAKEEWRKNNGFVAFLADTFVSSFAVPIYKVVEGAINGIWDTLSIVPSVVAMGVDAVNGGSFDPFKAYVDTAKVLDDANQLKVFDKYVSNWEMHYTYAADIFGNYNWFAKTLDSLGTSFGRMIPSMILTSLGVPGGLSEGLYYAGMGQEELVEMAKSPEFHDTPAWQLMLNAGLRTGAEYLVQAGLNKIIAPSFTDRAAFGYFDKVIDQAKKITVKSAIKTMLKDAVHEGLEEYYQQFSGYLINGMFGYFNESFNVNNKFDIQTQMDALILGFLGSLGSNVTMMGFSRITGGYKGGIKNFLMDWEFSQVMNDLKNNIEQVQKLASKGKMSTTKAAQAINSVLFTTQTITDYMSEIGIERSQSAIDLLNNITEYNKQKGYLVGDSSYDEKQNINSIVENSLLSLKEIDESYKSYITELQEDYKKYKKENGFFKRLKSVFNKRNVTKVDKVVSQEEVKTSEDPLDKAINETLEIVNSNIAIVTEDGNGSEKVDNKTVVIPKKEIENKKPIEIANEIAQRDIVERVQNSQRFTRVNEKLETIYKKIKGIDQRSRLTDSEKEGLVLQLMFDTEFQKQCLAEGSKETYELVSVLNEFMSDETIVKKHGEGSVYDQMMVNHIDTAIKGLKKLLKDFLINQQVAEYESLSIFTDTEKRNIANKRFSKDMANRFIAAGKLSDDEYKVLVKRLNSTALSDSTKKTILDTLNSARTGKRTTFQDRWTVIRTIDNFYRGIFLSSYNGRTYMPLTTTSNQVFNSYLEQNGLTVRMFINIIKGENSYDGSNYTKRLMSLPGDEGLAERAVNDVQAYNKNLDIQLEGLNQPNERLICTLKSVKSDYSHFTDEEMLINRPNSAIETISKNSKEVMDTIVDNNDGLYNINETVFDPTVKLSKPVMDILNKNYPGQENDWEARLYAIREYLITRQNKSVAFKQNGTLAIVDLVDSFNVLKNKGIKLSDIKDGDLLTKHVHSRYLPGIGQRTVIKFLQKDDETSFYDSQSNTLFLQKENVPTLLRAYLVHETQHVIQVSNALNGGMDFEQFNDIDDNETTRSIVKKIFKEIKQIAPELTEGISNTDINGMKELVARIVYYASGENSAYGASNSYYQFIPFVSERTDKGTVITTPLGNRYVLPIGKERSKRFLDNDFYLNKYDIFRDIYNSKRFKKFYDMTFNTDKSHTIAEYKSSTGLLYLDEDGETGIDDIVIPEYRRTPLIKVDINVNLGAKRMIFNYLSSDLIEDYRRAFAASLGITQDQYEEFKNVKIPFFRASSNDINDLSVPLNSVYPAIGVLNDKHFLEKTLLSKRRSSQVYLMIGEFTLNDLLIYFDGREAILSSDAFKNNYIENYKVKITDEGLYFTYFGKLKNVSDVERITNQTLYLEFSDDDLEKYEYANYKYDHYIYGDYNRFPGYYVKDGFLTLLGENYENLNFNIDYGIQDGNLVYNKYKVYEFAVFDYDLLSTPQYNGAIVQDVPFEYDFGKTAMVKRVFVPAKNELESSLKNFCLFRIDGSIFPSELEYDYSLPPYIMISFATSEIRVLDDKFILKTSGIITNKQIETIKFLSNEYGINNLRIYHSDKVFDFSINDNLNDAIKNEFTFNPNDVFKQRTKKLKKEPEVKEIDNEELQKKKEAERKAKYNERRRLAYVSNQDARGSNLEYYIEPGRPIFIDPDTQDFIKNVDSVQLDEELWDMIGGKQKGTLRSKNDVIKYVKKNLISTDEDRKMNDYTLQMICKYIFHSKISSFDQLKALVDASQDIYALQSILWDKDKQETIQANIPPEIISQFAVKVASLPAYQKQYMKAVEYYSKYKGNEIDIHEDDLMLAFIHYYDGSLVSAMRAVNTAKWIAVHNFQMTNTSQSVDGEAKDRHGESYIVEREDEHAQDSFEAVMDEYSVSTLEQMVYDLYWEQNVNKWAKKGWSAQKIRDGLVKLKQVIHKMERTELINLIGRGEANRIQGQAPETNISSTEKTTVPFMYGKRTNVRTRVKVNANIATKYISPKDKGRFLSENGDIFDENMKLKRETYEGKSEQELSSLLDRILKIKEKARANAYRTKAQMQAWEVNQRKIAREKKKANKLQGIIDNGIAKTFTKDYELGDRHSRITIDSTTNMPEVVRKIMDSSLSQTYKTEIAGLAEAQDDIHIRTSRREFIAANYEVLASLSEADCEDIINFFENMTVHGTLDDDNVSRKFEAFTIYTLAYISGLMEGTLNVSQDLKNRADNIITQRVGAAGTILATWRQVIAGMKSKEAEAAVFKQNVRRLADVEVSDALAAELIIAVRKHDIPGVELAMDKIEADLKTKYKMNKRNFFDKCLKIQRAAMLSSPGTMIRNAVSNVIVTQGNKAADAIGKLFLGKMKRFSRFGKDGSFTQGILEGQYILTGTEVTEDVKQFIQVNFIDNGLFKAIQDGISKYDSRRITKRTRSESIVADMIIEHIKSKVFAENQFNTDYRVGKVTNDLINLVFKGLSDDRWVNRRAISIFGKMLTEDEIRSGKKITEATPEIYEKLAEAYTLASYEYMRRPNFANNIEQTIRIKLGPEAYFVYKQIFPFAVSSINWAIEALNYTPIGLGLAIKDVIRLEHNADVLDQKRQRGERVVSSQFTEYLTKQRLGKGIIGSIVFGLGAALGAAGIIRLEKDDEDKLTLYIGNDVYIDISNIFGASSLLAGAALTCFKYSEDLTFWDALMISGDTIFADWIFTDVFNSFRYQDGITEWLMKQPFDVIGKFVPNVVKLLATVIQPYERQYNKGFVGVMERFVTSSIPGLSYAFPTVIDPYTGKNKMKYKLSPLFDILGQSGIKIHAYDVSDAEKEAVALGLNKGNLTGNYEDFKELGLKLSTNDINALNAIYGTLNEKELNDLFANKKKYRVQMPDGTYKELIYKNMSDEQKKSVINRIMTNNASIAKIYIGTRKGLKYYTTNDERQELLKLGIKNVYLQTDKKKGWA